MPFVLFIAIFVLLIIFDLRTHKLESLTHKEALIRTGSWASLALLFNSGIYYVLGKTAAIEFLTGYILEFSLSVDNLFVFIMLFSYFRTDLRHQSKILFWGILGALVFRFLLITIGIYSIQLFRPLIYFFGLFLIITSFTFFKKEEEAAHIEELWVIRQLRKIMPIDTKDTSGNFFCIKNSKLYVTPVLVTLLTIEFSDIIFACDSITAIFGVTQNAFIAFTSNAFAIIGLRSLFFALQGHLKQFEYLHYGIFGALLFVGLKMLLSFAVHIEPLTALVVLAIIVSLSLLPTFLCRKK